MVVVENLNYKVMNSCNFTLSMISIYKTGVPYLLTEYIFNAEVKLNSSLLLSYYRKRGVYDNP